MHFPNITPCPHKFDSDLGAFVDNLVAIVRKLWRVRGRIKFYFPRDELASEKERCKREQRHLHG